MTGWAQMRAANARTAAASLRGEAEHLLASADPAAAERAAKSLVLARAADRDAEVYGALAWHEAEAAAAANLAQAGQALEAIRGSLTGAAA